MKARVLSFIQKALANKKIAEAIHHGCGRKCHSYLKKWTVLQDRKGKT